MKFCAYDNNGVTALVQAEHFEEVRVDPHSHPIFTFRVDERYEATDSTDPVVGPISLMHRLLQGHTVEYKGYFHVPFSNGYERSSVKAYRDAELRFRVTPKQVFDTFGATLPAGAHA
jgi:hypothetical protein